MKKIGLVLILAAAITALGACRAEHLGPRYGQAYRATFARQIASQAPPPANQDSEDAKRVLAAHRGANQQQQQGPSLPQLNLAGGR